MMGDGKAPIDKCSPFFPPVDCSEMQFLRLSSVLYLLQRYAWLDEVLPCMCSPPLLYLISLSFFLPLRVYPCTEISAQYLLPQPLFSRELGLKLNDLIEIPGIIELKLAGALKITQSNLPILQVKKQRLRMVQLFKCIADPEVGLPDSCSHALPTWSYLVYINPLGK